MVHFVWWLGTKTAALDPGPVKTQIGTPIVSLSKGLCVEKVLFMAGWNSQGTTKNQERKKAKDAQKRKERKKGLHSLLYPPDPTLTGSLLLLHCTAPHWRRDLDSGPALAIWPWSHLFLA